MDRINRVLERYQSVIDSSFGLIEPDVLWLFNVLVVLNIVMAAAMWAFASEGDQVVVKLARKIIFIGVFAWLIGNWAELTNVMGRSFMELGFRAGGDRFAEDYVLQPGNIAYRGFTASEPMIRAIEDLSGVRAFFANFPQIALLTLSVLAVLIAFFVIAIQVVVAILMFKLGTLAAFVLVPFAVLSKTAFIAERPLGWVVASGVRLMVLTLVVGIGDDMFRGMVVPVEDMTVRTALDIALAAIVLMILSILATRLAGDLVSGGPSLGAGAAAGAVGGAAGVVLAGGQGAVGGGQSVAAGAAGGSLKAVQAAAAVKTAGASVAASVAAQGLKGAATSGASKSLRASPTAIPGAARSVLESVAATGEAGKRNRQVATRSLREGGRTLGRAGGGGGSTSARVNEEDGDS
ncbi:MAG: P-type conjugative transfer protein TrbL [Planctomycetota bacterium]